MPLFAPLVPSFDLYTCLCMLLHESLVASFCHLWYLAGTTCLYILLGLRSWLPLSALSLPSTNFYLPPYPDIGTSFCTPAWVLPPAFSPSLGPPANPPFMHTLPPYCTCFIPWPSSGYLLLCPYPANLFIHPHRLSNSFCIPLVGTCFYILSPRYLLVNPPSLVLDLSPFFILC